jgi:mRNA-degrading endonuclease YafQ of YafQ-DinJ toxin-antitoxin module
MREVKYSSAFKRDYRREKSGRYSKKLDALLMKVVNLLADDTPPATPEFRSPTVRRMERSPRLPHQIGSRSDLPQAR